MNKDNINKPDSKDTHDTLRASESPLESSVTPSQKGNGSKVILGGSTAYNRPHKVTSITTERQMLLSIGFYIFMVIAMVISGIWIATSSTASYVISEMTEERERSGLEWDSPPMSMKHTWSITGYNGVISTPGAAVAVKDNGLVGIDDNNGEEVWKYIREDSTLCHATEADSDVVALFDSGNGCTEIIKINAATGERVAYAMYSISDKESPARLVSGNRHVAIVTPERVRFLSSTLTPRAEFGDRPDELYPDDQTVSGCEIADVAIGPDHGIVSAKCDDQDTWHVNAVDLDPDEATKGVLDLDVNTKSTQPVTIPMVSLAQVLFLVPGDEPTVYAWQLDKQKEQVDSWNIRHGYYPRGMWDFPSIGYVWLTGETVNVRHGSEDISQSQERGGVIGNPLPASRELILPQRDGVTIWTPRDDIEIFIPIEGFSGTDFAFAGDTIMTFDRNDDNGTIHAYNPGDRT